MKDQFATYEIAKKLKKLGFDQKCIAWFSPNHPEIAEGTLIYIKQGQFDASIPAFTDSDKVNVFSNLSKEDVAPPVAAPLWQQAIDWLREKHNICIAEMGTAKKPTFELFINQKHVTGFEYATRKGALQAAVKKALLFIEETIENAK